MKRWLLDLIDLVMMLAVSFWVGWEMALAIGGQ